MEKHCTYGTQKQRDLIGYYYCLNTAVNYSIQLEPQPKFKIVLSKRDDGIERLCVLFVVLMWFISIYAYFKMPQIIPLHYDTAGKPNNFGNKTILLFLPILATAISLLLTWLNRRPHIFNYPVRITENNAARMYSGATSMLRFLKLGILIIFNIVILFAYLTTMGIIPEQGMWLVPFILLTLWVPCIILIVRHFKAK